MPLPGRQGLLLDPKLTSIQVGNHDSSSFGLFQGEGLAR
jgi:hypothetical protein